MKNYVVLYVEPENLPLDPPLAFVCDADDTEHAEKQCEDAYPDCEIVWVYEGTDVEAAFNDWWNA